MDRKDLYYSIVIVPVAMAVVFLLVIVWSNLLLDIIKNTDIVVNLRLSTDLRLRRLVS